MISVWLGTKKLTTWTTCILLILMCFVNTPAIGQPTDCTSTLPICSNGTINQSSNGSGFNDFALAGNNPGCLVTNEHQSVWMYVQIESGTTLGFDIIPNILGQDFDFAVFGPNVDCNNLGNPIRCSYAAPFGNAATGMNGSNSDLSEGASGNGYVRWLDVIPGESYYVLVDNFSASFQGFTLNWTGSGVLDCSITLPCPEVDLGPNSSVCDNGTLVLGAPTGPSDTYLWNTGETTPTITIADSGTYWLEVNRRNSCIVRDSIYIGLAETPEINLGNDTLICEGSSVILDAQHPLGTSYLWNDGFLSPLYTVTEAGTYTVQVSNNGCIGVDAIVVTLDDKPKIYLGRDTILCGGVSLELNAASPVANSYEWQDGSGGPTYNVISDGNYWVKAYSEACVGGDTIQVNFGDYPVFDLGDDRTLCEGTILTLNAFAPQGSTYIWQDSSTDFTLDVTTSGTYTVVVANPECSGTDSVGVTFIPFPQLNLGPDTVICAGYDFALDAFSVNATDYLWQDGSDGEMYPILIPGLYTVTVNNQMCQSTDSIMIEFDDVYMFSLGSDTLLCNGTEYTISVDGPPEYIFTWQDNSSENSLTINQQGIYYLTVENQCGIADDTVIVRYGSCNCDFFFPTGFTPNGDGLNDSFSPFVDCDSLQSYSMEVFNRWGEPVFKTANPQEAWNASANFSDFLMDVYVWIIEYKWTWLGEEMIRRDKGRFAIIK